MWKKIASLLRQVMAKVGLIKNIEKMSDLKDVELNEELYEKIDVWKQLYKGHYSEWHNIRFKTVSGQHKRKLATLGMPKVVSQEIANLVFNEKCEISISDEGLSNDIEDVFKQNNFYKEFQRYIEYSFAMGGMVVKGYAEDGKIKFSYVTADSFIPIGWNNKEITDGVFVHQFKRGDKHYTHLEWHMWKGDQYIIRNEVYKSSSSDELGSKANLKDFFPQLKEEVTLNGLKRSLFIYIKPNTANNVDMSSPLGISVFANALGTLHSLDIAFDSYQREFKFGKKRILVPHQMIKTVIDPDTQQPHRYFDADDEVYEAFKYDMDGTGKDIQDISVALRVTEHIDAINALLNILAMQIGFSAGSFTFDGQGVKTATEVVSENSKTFRTKKGHETIVEEGIKELIEVVVQVGELYNILSRPPEEYEVSVAFDDSIIEDMTTEISQQVQLVTNKMQSLKRAIMVVHKVTEEEAEEIMAEVREEQKTVREEEVDLFGMNRNRGAQ
jgi:A118 family predicted phage portal protein